MNGRPCILVVDDNDHNRELARCLLLAAGFEVEIACDPQAARASVRGRPPDLILMDIQLPGLDGLALARELKADRGLADLPIVAFTAYAMRGDAQRFLAAGCAGYLAKPIDVRTFADEVRALLPRGTS